MRNEKESKKIKNTNNVGKLLPYTFRSSKKLQNEAEKTENKKLTKEFNKTAFENLCVAQNVPV